MGTTSPLVRTAVMYHRSAGPFLLLLFLVGALLLRVIELMRSEPQVMPWTPLSLSDPIGRFTPYKIGKLINHEGQCRRLLEDVSAAYVTTLPVHGPSGCGYADGVKRLNGIGIHYSPQVIAACPIVASLYMFEHQVVQPIAHARFHQPVVEIFTFGTYSCRRIGNAAMASLSAHAKANAIDIAGFNLADGRRITLATHWDGFGPEALFLRNVRDGACRIFSTTLSPDCNAAPRDHLHFDPASRDGRAYCR